MYDIVTLEPGDNVVMSAVNAIVKGQEGIIPGPGGNYNFFAPGAVRKEGNGGTGVAVVVVVGHAEANELSGHKTFASYKSDCHPNVGWANAATIYLVACSTAAADGKAFLHGNIANEVQKTFPKATIWASGSAVTASTQAGDWQKLSPTAKMHEAHRH